MKISHPIALLTLILVVSCSRGPATEQQDIRPDLSFDRANAEQLAALPLLCLRQEYPNKLGQVLGSEKDLGEPGRLHPAFYGCFDWHSSVHGHWSLVWLLKNYPGMGIDSLARAILKENLGAENIQAEVEYFLGPHSSSYERTYGWAWLLKLALEVHEWEDPLAHELEINLAPLCDLIVQRYMDFLPKLLYPIRVGEHTNTAFGLGFAWDYAAATGKDSLRLLIESRARDFYLQDRSCPVDWEPGGFDFLSPCLEEVDLMMRILPAGEFRAWISAFMPELAMTDYELEPARVADRSDGKLVHLDGLNFSRAWVLYRLAGTCPEYEHLEKLAREHLEYSLPNLLGDDYEGGHWLASFAFYALDSRP